ncbi:hypothetical protein D3C86_2251830 [compost metagenome]
MSVQHEVTQFMSRIEPTTLGGLERVQKDVGLIITPEGVGIQMPSLFDKRENTYPVSFKQVD